MQRGTHNPPQMAKLQNEPNPNNGHLADIAQSTPCSDPTTHTDQNRCATMRIPSPCNAHQSNYNWGRFRAPGRYHGAAACARWLPLGSRAASTPSSLISSKRLMSCWKPSTIAIGGG